MLRHYKLKFGNHEQAQEVFESVKDIWYCDPALVDYDKVEYDIILKQESEILNEFEVFPKVIKFNFL